MSTTVEGFRPPDDDWVRMKAVWDACMAAGVAMPAEVEDFFEGAPPDAHGVEVDICAAVRKWEDSRRAAEGFEVDVTALPVGVRVVRFINSW